MVDRIKQVMEHYEETPASFAEKIGVNRSNLTHVFSGRNQPSLDFAKKVLVAFPEVSTEWLIMGVGKMIKDPEEMVPVKKSFVQTDLFDTVDESETIVPSVNEVSVLATENEAQQTSVDIPLENVKPESLETHSVERVQQIDTKDVNTEEGPVLTAPESNIHQQTVPQPEKFDPRVVEHTDVKSAPTYTDPQPKAKPVSPLMEKNTDVQVEQVPASAPKEKKIEKIIFFYDDDSFKVFHP